MKKAPQQLYFLPCLSCNIWLWSTSCHV